MKTFSKEALIQEFCRIESLGWIENYRGANDGSVGNILEDLLGIEENNLPIPNAAEWELKAQRASSSSLTTMFHIEPSPRACKFVSNVLLPLYGWKHALAGKKYPENEMSFRQTISGNSCTARGFLVKINAEERKIFISFSAKNVKPEYNDWLNDVCEKVGLSEITPQPYWGFDDLASKAGTKLLNCFYVSAESKRENGKEFFHYNSVYMLSKFSFEAFLKEIEKGRILIDFDARTGHNHGTKFRMQKNCLPQLYENVKKII